MDISSIPRKKWIIYGKGNCENISMNIEYLIVLIVRFGQCDITGSIRDKVIFSEMKNAENCQKRQRLSVFCVWL